MSTARDRKPKGGGQSPQFKMRISPSLKEQMESEAEREGVSLANWLKQLAREKLQSRGIEPKG
ncbi:MAG: toxin-antitoxin system HicB family antitoxin [Candidatus Symbiopectobacterium sp. Dall1.0]|nr:toxin-antitoxin system HicB family antitoxin [Candidatus Symbiopectobacterium sp. Dall1.0]